MDTFKSLSNLEGLRIPSLQLDYFQQEILNNLHLEFFLEQCRAIVTPEGKILVTGPAREEEEQQLREILDTKAKGIQKLRQYIIYELSLYSSLLETNSYYITLNNNLVICRLVEVADHPGDYEAKLYTIAREDLPHNYKDKIYIGRDFLSMGKTSREHLGLKHIRNSLRDQIGKLQARFEKLVTGSVSEELNQEYLNEIAELIEDFAQVADEIMESNPVDISSRTMSIEQLTGVNRRFRDLKHILIEMESTSRELETEMFDMNLTRAVRYVTKFNKDLANYINYIMFKINGRISDSVNKIHI